MASEHSHNSSDSSEKRDRKNLINIILGNWATVISFVGLLVAGTIAWNTLTISVKANQDQIIAVQNKQIEDEQSIQSAAVVQAGQYTQIETDLQWIKARLGN